MRVPSCFGSQVLVVVRKLRDPSLENRNGIAFFIALLCYVQSNKRTTQKSRRFTCDPYQEGKWSFKGYVKQVLRPC